MVGNFRRQKNYEFALELFKKLEDYELHIFGWVVDENYHKRILQFVKANKLEKKVKIINDCKDIGEIIHHYSIAMHTALSESGPLCLIEYLSAGLPFLSFDTGSVVESVKEECPEMVVDTWNINTWLERLRVIEGQYLYFQDKCIYMYKREYSEEEYVKKCLKIYNTVLSS